MARIRRLLSKDVQGRVRHNYNWDAINEDSTVIITAGEWQAQGGVFGAEGRFLLGEASVYVTSICPHGDGNEAGGVEFHVHVDWEQPLNVMLSITVLDNKYETLAVV
jgi:hypothetical protein